MRARRVHVSVPTTLLLGFTALTACGSSSEGPAGGPVSGLADAHCAGVTPIAVNEASCHPAVTPTDPLPPEEEAPVLYNAEGDDDDCKYHVSFTSTPVRLNEAATFDVTATLLASPGTPARGAGIDIESYLADNQFHVLSALPPNAAESPAGSGHYKVTPVKFDASGRWVVRFHLYEDCSDLSEDSPHGHVAFYVDVP
jgi:hypothetical protein